MSHKFNANAKIFVPNRVPMAETPPHPQELQLVGQGGWRPGMNSFVPVTANPPKDVRKVGFHEECPPEKVEMISPLDYMSIIEYLRFRSKDECLSDLLALVGEYGDAGEIALCRAEMDCSGWR